MSQQSQTSTPCLPPYLVHTIQSNYLRHSPPSPTQVHHLNQEAVLSWKHTSGYSKPAVAVTSPWHCSADKPLLMGERQRCGASAVHRHMLITPHTPSQFIIPLICESLLCNEGLQRGVLCCCEIITKDVFYLRLAGCHTFICELYYEDKHDLQTAVEACEYQNIRTTEHNVVML